MISSKIYRGLLLTQKSDCRCFYFNSKHNKSAKRYSRRVVKRKLDKYFKEYV